MAAATFFVIVISSLYNAASASALSSMGSTVLGAIREVYTTNALCGKSKCINPIFPGMEDLHRLQQSKWISSSLMKTTESMRFCKNAVTYDPALPLPLGGGNASVTALVQRQDNAAVTMFNYHLAGLGLEAWDFKTPEHTTDDCIKSVWRMVCYTYFPRAQIGIQDGAYSNYMTPCKSSCQNYVRACNVECCDESVQCVFEHTKKLSNNQKVTTEGYAPHDGPSSLCTGASRRSATPMGAALALVLLFTDAGVGALSHLGGGRRLFQFGLLGMLAMSLQGCDYDVPIHKVGNWRAEPDYLLKHEFIPPGGSADMASLNSCQLQRLSQTLQCSGRGICKLWSPNDMTNTLSFCKCDTHWADPECRTKRKSQLVGYLLSLFTGFLGFDQFYLGFPSYGLFKLFTLGGGGILWVYDIIRIGSAPTYTGNYLVAADLPHFAYVLMTTMFACLLGFWFTYWWVLVHRSNKRKEAMLLTLDEEARQKEAIKPMTDSYGSAGKSQKPVIMQSFNDMQNAGPMGAGMGGMGGMGGPMGAMGGMGGMGGPMGTMGPMGPMGGP